MLRFFASDWDQIIREIESLRSVLNSEVFTAVIQGQKAKLVGPLGRIAFLCARLGLKFSGSYAREIIHTINASSSLAEYAKLLKDTDTSAPILNPTEFQREISILQKRIEDELKGREFFALDSKRLEYFGSPIGLLSRVVPHTHFHYRNSACNTCC